jgi:acetylglutamate kinase
MTLTDVEGVKIRNEEGEEVVISTLNEQEIHDLIERGIISGGMIPKITGCLETVKRGVGVPISSTGASRTACCSRSSPTKVSAP